MKTCLKRIYTKDGIELVGLLYEPDVKTSEVLVHVHGMGGNFYENSFLDAIAQTLTVNGIAFFAANNRGCESFKDLTKIENGKKTSVRIGDAYEKFEDCLFDIGSAIDAVEKWGFSKIHLSGHSLGSPKAAYYLIETKDKRIASLLLLSPSDMLGLERSQPERFERTVKEAKEMITVGKGEELLSEQVWDEYPISADTYISLFGDTSKSAIFNFHIPSDKLEKLSNIKIPLFAVMGRKDDVLIISIEEIMERIKKASVNSPHVKTKILGDADHGYSGDEQNLADEILKWMKQ